MYILERGKLYIHMAKKYLLYIHDELFDKEPNKSKLINNLLERHYHDTTDGGKTQEQVHADIMEAHKALSEAKVPEEGRYVATPEGMFGPTKLEPKSMKFCKDGHPIPSGRSRCLGKGCKYS